MLDPRVPLVLATNAAAVIRIPQVIRLAKETLSATSPRFQRHLQELECPSKRQWTTVERICFEMIATEKDYVSDITALVEQFLDPLDAFADRFCDTKTELPAFTALRDAARFILAIHQDLLKLLEPPRRQPRFFTFDRVLGGSVSSPNGAGPMEAVTRVTKAFEATIEYMKVYAQYCANYLPAAEELKSNAKLLDAFTLTQTCSENETPCDPVTDLIKPVQRICRYTLLFRALVLNAASPEEALLSQRALDNVQRVSDLYIIHCESEQKKKEFVMLLRCAIARCARTKAPPRSSVNLIVPKLSVKLWHSITRGDFSQTLSLSYGNFLRRHPNVIPSALREEDSTEESKYDDPHHTERLLRSQSATSGAA
ncbi:hypothetical protein BBJ29_000815 [Phytophthora kernoviae]|uniref:DH domain-containing protein n=1 Tax=Phytophthora kernoviae TaxID=325452 RepID=A0A3F2S3M6_9STRA|nr:hypothetical protein BBJ29_000815 [Phytophthora kernoviae]RLN69105.1 hypothetical protein BBP00_00000531 [Phytophthora kernoviae]